MQHKNLIDSTKRDIAEIKSAAEAYFETASHVLTDVDSYFGRSAERDHFWARLPEDIQQNANTLAQKTFTVVGRLVGPVKNSSLLTEADQRDLSFLAKTARAAIFLRRYSHWDTEILHDEGTILGVQRAGQSENQPLPPSDALRIFQDSLQQLTALIELLSASEIGLQPSETANPMLSRVRQNTAFIMMQMDSSIPELDDVYDRIKKCFDAFGIRATRADDIEHEGIITDRILHEISTSEFLIADLTGMRPNVYYEVGYAHALKKRVILYRKKGTQLHFDLAGYNCPDYSSLRELEDRLMKRLEQMTNKRPCSR